MHTQSSSKICNEYFTEGRVKNDPLFNNLPVKTPQRMRKPTLEFIFKYLKYVMLGMSIFENGILEQNNDYLLYEATDLKSTTSFSTKPDFFLDHFQTKKPC